MPETHRMRTHLFVAVAFTLGITACHHKKAVKPADFTVDLMDMAREIEAGPRDAIRAKYEGKTFQVSGTVKELTRPIGLNDTRGITLDGLDPKLAAAGSPLILLMIDKDSTEDIKRFDEKVKVGDQVTLRCSLTFIGKSLTTADHCVFAGK